MSNCVVAMVGLLIDRAESALASQLADNLDLFLSLLSDEPLGPRLTLQRRGAFQAGATAVQDRRRQWWHEDYDVIGPDGLVIGRIFEATTSPVGTPWMWTLTYGDHEDRTPINGYEATCRHLLGDGTETEGPLRFLRPLSITIFLPPFIGIIFALVALFRLCPSYCLNLFSCFSYNNTPYLNRPMIVGRRYPNMRHVAGAL